MIVLLGLFLALLYCIPPGAVLATALQRGMRFGWRGAFGVELGSVLGDAVYGMLAFVGLKALLRLSWAHAVVGACGTVLLLYLAYQAFRSATPALLLREEDLSGRGGTFWSAFAVGALMGLANPLGIAFWVSFGSVLAVHVPHPTTAELLIFFLSFVAGTIVYALLVGSIITWLRRFLTPRVFRLLSVLCGVFLMIFGLTLGVQIIA